MRIPVIRGMKPMGFMILLSLLVFSCSDKKTSAGTCTMTWNYNGSSVTSDSVGAYLFAKSIVANKDMNNAANAKTVELFINNAGDPFQPGTYDVSNPLFTIHYTSGSLNGVATTGSFTINSRHGTTINGSFSCTLTGGLTGSLSGSFANVDVE